VTHDEPSGVVRLPITRFPLIKQRRVLGNLYDWNRPIRAVVIVRNVSVCDIEDRTTPELGDEVELLFGIRLQDDEVYACSAEEDRCRACYSVTAKVAELDIEITDDPEAVSFSCYSR